MAEIPWGWELWEKKRPEMLALAVERTCPNCSSENKEPYFASQCGYYYVNCLSCGMIYVDPAIPSHVWSQVYATDPEFENYMRDLTIRPLSEHTECDPANTERFSFYFERVMEKCGFEGLGGMKYLDIGTFNGDALATAHEHYGMDPHGIEARAEIADLISATRGLKIIGAASDDMDSSIFGGRFHLISAFESLEHAYDPKTSLSRIHDNLTDGGIVIVTVPNIDNMEIQFLREYSPHVTGGLIGPGHINLFGKKTLTELFTYTGFDVVDVFSQYSSSIEYMIYKVNGLEKHIPCYNSILTGEFEDGGPQLYDQEQLAPFLGAFREWENARLQGPILGMIGRKPGKLPMRPKFVPRGNKRLALSKLKPTDIAWTSTNITVEDGTIIYSGPVNESYGYAVLMKPVEIEKADIHGNCFKISGDVKYGEISVGLLKDGAWDTQETVNTKGLFMIELPTDGPGTYQVVVSHNLSTIFLNPDGRRTISEWEVSGYEFAAELSNYIGPPHFRAS